MKMDIYVAHHPGQEKEYLQLPLLILSLFKILTLSWIFALRYIYLGKKETIFILITNFGSLLNCVPVLLQ